VFGGEDAWERAGGAGNVREALDTARKRTCAVLTSTPVSVSRPTERQSEKHITAKFAHSYLPQREIIVSPD